MSAPQRCRLHSLGVRRAPGHWPRVYAVNERILIIDDDAVVQQVARASLERDGYIVHCAGDGAEGLELSTARSPALIVLDLGLPDVTGETVLQEVRRRSEVPIIVLSAKGRMEERVTGLGLGADDYLPKPFSPLELVARVKALLRRAGGQGPAPGLASVARGGGGRAARPAGVPRRPPADRPRPPRDPRRRRATRRHAQRIRPAARPGA